MKFLTFMPKGMTEKDIIKSADMFKFEVDYTLKYSKAFDQYEVSISEDIHNIHRDYILGYFWGISDHAQMVSNKT